MFEAPVNLVFGAAVTEGVHVSDAEIIRFLPLGSEIRPYLCWAELKSPPGLLLGS